MAEPSTAGTIYQNRSDRDLGSGIEGGFFVDKIFESEGYETSEIFRENSLPGFLNQKSAASKTLKVQKKSNDKKNDEKGIDYFVKRSKLIIYEASSLRPFLGRNRDKITITPNRVTLTYNGFLSHDEYPMPIENVIGSRVYQDFMFGSLFIDTFGLTKPEPLKYMRINEARLARRYILALIEAKKNNVTLPVDDINELRRVLKEMGTVRFGTESPEYHRI